MRQLNVVLVEPLGSDFGPSLFTKGNSLEPVALEWLAAYVDKRSETGAYKVVVVQQRDARETDDDLFERISLHAPDVVGFSMRTHYYQRCRSIAARLKTRFPSVLIVVGGQHPSIAPSIAADEEFDVAVMGEGEATFLEILKTWRENLGGSTGACQRPHWSDVVGNPIPGTAHLQNGAVLVGKPRKRIADLDAIPTPRRERELLDGCRQWNIAYPSPTRQRGLAQVSWSRGCTGKCAFCTSPILWSDDSACSPVVTRSATNLIEELRMLKSNYGTNYVYFNDLSFNAPAGGKTQLLALCRDLVDNGIHAPCSEQEPTHVEDSIHWFALCKVGISDAEAKAMALAGCSKIGVGVESLCASVVRSLGKQYGMRPEQAGETLRNTDRYGVINRAYVIIGTPDDPPSLEDETVEGLLALPVDQVRLAFFTPYPGTEAWKRFSDRLTTSDLSFFSQEYPVVRCDHFSSTQLEQIRRNIALRFYTDERYTTHCLGKINRFPWLKESYSWHFRDLEKRLSHIAGRTVSMPVLD